MKVHWRAAETPGPCGISYRRACWKLLPRVSFIWKRTSVKWKRLSSQNFILRIQMIMSCGARSADWRISPSGRPSEDHCRIFHYDVRATASLLPAPRHQDQNGVLSSILHVSGTDENLMTPRRDIIEDDQRQRNHGRGETMPLNLSSYSVK